jgi:hypothetical protein
MEAMQQASRLGCDRVVFIGGEPTLHPDLPDLLEYGRSLDLKRLEVFTNGCQVSDTLKKALWRYAVDMAFSVYSLDEKSHDAVTGQAGSLAKTLSSIRWALDAGLNVRVAIIELEANAGTAKATTTALSEMGVPSIRIDRVRRIGRGLRQEQPPQSLFEELCGRCGHDRLCLASSGQLFPCPFSRFYPVGRLDLGLAAALEGSDLRSFLSTLEAVQRDVRIQAGGGDYKRKPCTPKGACVTQEEPCATDEDPCLPSFGLDRSDFDDWCMPDFGPLPPIPCTVSRM